MCTISNMYVAHTQMPYFFPNIISRSMLNAEIMFVNIIKQRCS